MFQVSHPKHACQFCLCEKWSQWSPVHGKMHLRVSRIVGSDERISILVGDEFSKDAFARHSIATYQLLQKKMQNMHLPREVPRDLRQRARRAVPWLQCVLHVCCTFDCFMLMCFSGWGPVSGNALLSQKFSSGCSCDMLVIVAGFISIRVWRSSIHGEHGGRYEILSGWLLLQPPKQQHSDTGKVFEDFKDVSMCSAQKVWLMTMHT